MAKEDFTQFTREALIAILNALGVAFPLGENVPVSELAQIVEDSRGIVGEPNFSNAVAAAQGLDHLAPPVVANPTVGPGPRSLDPGVSILWTITHGVGLVSSETWDPPTPLEYGRKLDLGDD
jgi:hypothetical protein